MKKKAQSTKASQSRSPKKPVKPSVKKVSGNDRGDIIELILRDHKPLKKLIRTLKDGDLDRMDKEGPFEEFVPLLVAHAKAEEQSLYVQMKEIEDLRVESYEGDTEHAIAEQLIHEINASPDDDEWNAKVKVIAELVEHHIEEEEEEMLKDVEVQMDSSTRVAVGEIYTQVKTELEMLTRPRRMSPQKMREQQLS